MCIRDSQFFGTTTQKNDSTTIAVIQFSTFSLRSRSQCWLRAKIKFSNETRLVRDWPLALIFAGPGNRFGPGGSFVKFCTEDERRTMNVLFYPTVKNKKKFSLFLSSFQIFQRIIFYCFLNANTDVVHSLDKKFWRFLRSNFSELMPEIRKFFVISNVFWNVFENF